MSVNLQNMFIGSSSEGLKVAEAVKSHFDSIFDVSIWKENVFELNESYLNSLLRAANWYDYAVLILTPDEVLRSRKKQYQAARDNVIFEHGLFLGRLGPRRAFIIREESVKILSDFAGITIAQFKMPKQKSKRALKKALEDACTQIKSTIEKNMEKVELGFYPSTSLAIGYFENFITKVFYPLIQNKYVLQIDGKERPELKFKSSTLTIAIPNSLSEVDKNYLRTFLHTNRLQQIRVMTEYRDYPFYVRGLIEGDEVLKLYDIPTTLLSSRKTIEVILTEDAIGYSPEQEKLEKREIRNFQLALEIQIKKVFHDYYEKRIFIDNFDCLKEKD